MANYHLLWIKLCLVLFLLFMGVQQVFVGIRYEGLGISNQLSTTSFRPKWRNLFANRSPSNIGEQDSRFRYRSTRKDGLTVKRKELQRIFRAEVGVRESTGKNDGPRIKEYLAITNLGEGYAYCSAFLSFCFAKAGYTEPRTPWSPALFPKNRVIWEKGASLKPNTYYPIPTTGDVFGLWFPNLGRIAHAGFIDEWGETIFISVEGNTNEVGSNEGDGVYRKRRRVNSIHQVANWIE